MCVRWNAQPRELNPLESTRFVLSTVMIAVSTNGPTGGLVSLLPLSPLKNVYTKMPQQAIGNAAAQRTDCSWLLLLLSLQCPRLGWVGANHRKSGQNKKTRRSSYPGPRWMGPNCRDGLSPSRTFPPLVVPSLAVPPQALPSRSAVLAGPLLSRAGGARFMPPNPAQNVPPVALKVLPGPHKRHINSCPREREGATNRCLPTSQVATGHPGGYYCNYNGCPLLRDFG